jgi:HK97 family phage portal protein
MARFYPVQGVSDEEADTEGDHHAMKKGWLSRLFERRSVGPQFSEMFTATSRTASGAVVTPETAMAVPEVKGCVKVLSEDVGKTPLRLRQRIGQDVYVDQQEHDLWELLHDLPNPETDAFTFKREITSDMLRYGVAYAQIVRVNGRVQSLWRLPVPSVRVDRDEQRRKRWTVTTATGREVFLFDPSMPPILEIKFDSPIHHCRELIGTALTLQQYTGRFFSNGARPAGALLHPEALGEEAAKRLRESWQETFGGARNSHKVAILEEGMKYEPFASPNDNAQLNELMLTLRSQIAGAFRVPPFKIADLSKSNYSNVEALSIEYLTGTLDPLFTAWEHSIRRDLLTTRQYNVYTAQFDRSALIQSDMASLHTALATGRQNGIYSVNDCRRKLGENPIPAEQGGDLYLVNSAMVPIARAGQQAQAQGAAWATANDKEAA